jgi:hypothetical protein
VNTTINRKIDQNESMIIQSSSIWDLYTSRFKRISSRLCWIASWINYMKCSFFNLVIILSFDISQFRLIVESSIALYHKRRISRVALWQYQIVFSACSVAFIIKLLREFFKHYIYDVFIFAHFRCEHDCFNDQIIFFFDFKKNIIVKAKNVSLRNWKTMMRK